MRKRGIVIAYGRKWDRRTCEKRHFAHIPKIRGKRIGLYVLYKGRRIVYVGKSETNLRRRIDEHTKDHLKNKWDSFSWFISKTKYTADLEALLHKIFFRSKDIKFTKVRANFIEAKRFPKPKR